MPSVLLEPMVTQRKVFTEAPEWDALDSGWFSELQRAEWERFVSLPMPGRTDEAWRFANLKELSFDDYVNGLPVDEAKALGLRDRSRMSENPAAKWVFANGHLIEGVGISDELSARGVICLPFAEALERHGDRVREHFMRQPVQLGSEKFAAWHAALVASGVFVYVPKGVEVAGVIEVYHWLSGEGSSEFPHTLVVAEANAKVSVIDNYRSEIPTTTGFACGVADLIARDGAKLKYVCAQEWNERTKFIQLSSTTVGRDANVMSLIMNLGSAWARTESVSHLDGEGANSDMLSIAVPHATQEIDQRTLQLHKAPRTTSDLLYKNALYDKARTIFAGLIMVAEGAHQTDAYQKCRNLLLSDDAEANSMPGLEINADQVKCSHGATAGPITDEELFYLRARGIPKIAARQLVTFGFVHEVIERLGDATLEETLTRRLEKKFAGLM